MTTIHNIHSDIIREYIIPSFLFGDIRNVVQSCLFEIKPLDMINIIIYKDVILKTFSESFNIDIYNTLKNSSVSFVDFDKIIKDIRSYTRVQKHISFEIKEYTENSISDTILIHKLFKWYISKALYLNDIRYNITNNLIAYLTLVFREKHKIICIDDVSPEFSISLEKCLWVNVNINLYDIFEKYNLVHSQPRSYHLKSNIQKDNRNNIIASEKQKLATMIFLNYLVLESVSLKRRQYAIYELYRYLNYYPDIYKNYKPLGRLLVSKARDYMSDIQHQQYQVLPHYLSNLLYIELNKYITFSCATN